MAGTKILLYGRTGSGKTAQLGELAEYVFVKTGLPTILWTADKGGIKTIQPYIDLGLIKVVEIGSTDPFIFLNKRKAPARECRGLSANWERFRAGAPVPGCSRKSCRQRRR